MNFLTAPVLYALAGLCLLLGVTTGVQTLRLSHERTEHAETKAIHAAVLQDLATKTQLAAEAARALEHKAAQDLVAARDQHDKEIESEKAKNKTLARSGLAGCDGCLANKRATDQSGGN